MATIRLVPSTYTVTMGSPTVTDESNMYTDTTSDTYCTMTAFSGQVRATLKGFNFSAIPASATVNSYTVRLKYAQSAGTASTVRFTVVNGTGVIANTTASSIDTGSSYPINLIGFNTSNISWETLAAYGSNLGVTFVVASGATARIYGAEIEVNYTAIYNKVVYDGNTLIDLTDTTATAADVMQGKYFYGRDGVKTEGTASGGTPTLQSKTLNVSSAGTTTVTPDTGYDGLDEVEVNVPSVDPFMGASAGQYYDAGGGQYRWKADIFVEVNESEGDTAGFMADGYHKDYTFVRTAIPANTTVTPTESAQTIGEANAMMEGAVTVNAIPSNYVGSGITRRSSTDLTASGATVSVPSGYYASNASKAVASGTEGTPTATKGTVSNHAISVTPSVTNTAGYISGGTKTGTAVSVSASELVSGTVNITSSGNTDVTNYATASVASGSATASATKGTVSNHSVTVTPSVTRTAGYITAGSSNGTAVSVSASELVSGSQTITQNGTVDVTNLASVTVAVEGGGGSGMSVATATTTPSTASASIQFTGLSGEPTSFVVTSASDLATGASPYKTAAVVFDGTNLHGQIVTNTNNANASYSTSFTKSYSNGTLTITGTGTNFQANQYKLIYTYGGTSANIGTAETQVGSGATSISFTGLADEPDYFSVIFKSNFSTSSGYQRVMSVAYDGTNTYGVAMDSGAKALSSWSYTYNNGSLTVSSIGTNNGGYFHQPGYYQLTYGVGGTVEPTEIEVEPLSVTANGTYTAPTGKAYSPVTVNVSGGGGSVNVATTTWTNDSTSTVSHQFTGLSGTPKAAFLRCTTQLTRSSSNTYYYIADIVWDGTNTRGNYHLRSSGAYTDVPSTGTAKYNVSVGTNSITFSSTASSRSSAPGSFYNGTYELTYIY